MSLKSLFKSSPSKNTPSPSQGAPSSSTSTSNSAVQDSMKSGPGAPSSSSVLGAALTQQASKAKSGGLGALFRKAFGSGSSKQQQADEAEAKRAADSRIDDALLKLKLDDLLGELRPITFACLKQEAMSEVVSFIETHDGEHDSRFVWENFFVPGAAEELNTGKKEREELQMLADAGLYDAMDFNAIRERVLTEPMQQVKTRMLAIPEVRAFVSAKIGPAPGPEVSEGGEVEGASTSSDGDSKGGESGAETKKPAAKLGGISLAFHRTFKTGTWKQQQEDEAREREADEQKLAAAIGAVHSNDLLKGGLRAITFAMLRARSDHDVVDFIVDYENQNFGQHMWETYIKPKAVKEVNIPGSVRAEFGALAQQGRYSEMNFKTVHTDVMNSAIAGLKDALLATPEAQAVIKASLGLK
jgi:hypothetical protein